MAEPLPIEVDALDAVPEPLRPFYEERDGKFVLPVQVDDPAPLKEALRKEREAHREARRKLEALERKIRPVADAEADDPRIVALRKELEELRREREEIEAARQRERVQYSLKEWALAAGVAPAHVNNLLKLLDGRYELRGNEIVFLDADGTPVADDPASFFGKRLQKEFPFFYGRQAVGSGTPQGSPTTGGKLTREALEKMTPDEIRARLDEVREALRQGR
jgi:DNA repair exonuclease SbcCD ATPase subunit